MSRSIRNRKSQMREPVFRCDFTTLLFVALAIVIGLVVTIELWMPHGLR